MLVGDENKLLSKTGAQERKEVIYTLGDVKGLWR